MMIPQTSSDSWSELLTLCCVPHTACVALLCPLVKAQHSLRLGKSPQHHADLEAARLDLLALFRALDRMDVSAAEIPQRLIHQLFELDADYAEALWALDQPPGGLDLRAMLRDTLAALEQLPDALVRFRTTLPRRVHSTLPVLEPSVRKTLDPLEAYNMVPGRDPHNG